ncbi:heterokaryon incompatibility protein-domain-containing protein [Diplogelasinospora grovesii]|uniref:Heterokaryon incompatibility protein-domain-containing protein n=1 Tax=Diplogelasinospora grovesii TaxID=303347 RepID=A0AAN6NES2_9PEZI|nr:heterokaryon incompatibility protein-domain-containing protein [Diplogelasinospora grovesii]
MTNIQGILEPPCTVNTPHQHHLHKTGHHPRPPNIGMDTPPPSPPRSPRSRFLGRHVRRVSDIVTHRFQYAPLLDDSHSPASHDYCRIKTNEHGQRQCRGCEEICEMLREGEAQRRRVPQYTGTSASRIIHADYHELDTCAKVSGCDTCQIIQRALLLEQITGRDAKRLEEDRQRPVRAALNMSKSGDSLLITVDTTPGSSEPVPSASVALRPDRNPPLNYDPTRSGGRLRTDFNELRQVIRDCHENHYCTSKFRWSKRNPSWLLEILQNNRVRLVRRPPNPVDYVVLSYSWGNPETMPPEEWARIKAAGTKSQNGQPVPDRLNPFPQWSLPETMHDAITITQNLGFRYIWIDSVCIPKGTDWDTEASRMHEVYGNAAFTLAACSSTKATDPLLHDRLAWTHRSKECKLRGQWLYNVQMSLDNVRLGSPVAQRAWTLQEERLSPRMVYWTAQRWYWSCAEGEIVELSQLGCPPSPVADHSWSPPHRFLDQCRSGGDPELHEEWLDIAEAYTRRDLAEPKDRFLAISGLAVRFYNAKAESGSGNKPLVTEEYLAGLWRDNFARHLAWSVDTAVRPEGNLHYMAPSWSWASLPLCVRTRTKFAFTPVEHFRFLGIRYLRAAEGAGTSTIEWLKSQPKDLQADTREQGQAIEERGRNVKVVEVCGRFRRFISQTSEEVAWADIQWRRGDEEGFNFMMHPGQDLHARNLEDGRVVSKDAHGGELVAQLDYLLTDYDEKHKGVSLPEGAEKDLMCLELGKSAMLLLTPTPATVWGNNSYRRAGVCIGYCGRKGFFYGCEVKRILLA